MHQPPSPTTSPRATADSSSCCGACGRVYDADARPPVTLASCGHAVCLPCADNTRSLRALLSPSPSCAAATPAIGCPLCGATTEVPAGYGTREALAVNERLLLGVNEFKQGSLSISYAPATCSSEGHDVVPMSELGDQKDLSIGIQELKARSKVLRSLQDELGCESRSISQTISNFDQEVIAQLTKIQEELEKKKAALLESSAKLKASCDMKILERATHLEKALQQFDLMEQRFTQVAEASPINCTVLVNSVKDCRLLVKMLPIDHITKWEPFKLYVKLPDAQSSAAFVEDIGSISLIGPPLEVVELDIVSVTTTTVTVKWKAAIERGIPISGYEIHISETQGVQHQQTPTATTTMPTSSAPAIHRIVGPVCNGTIEGLKEGTEYDIRRYQESDGQDVGGWRWEWQPRR
ncbi:hypothetical protein Pelo_14068 [Pelomyxa schiedti]|nr:hypothetical protein Pelo_14068 [Pelomyxa schiedti]